MVAETSVTYSAPSVVSSANPFVVAESHYVSPGFSTPVSQHFVSAGTVVQPPLKSMFYNGKGSWKTFMLKFSMLAERNRLSDVERKEQLLYCLQGKAADYLASIWDTCPTFQDVVSRLEFRFGGCILPAAHRIEFQNASQKKSESDLDWADRITELADKAYRDLSNKNFVQHEVIQKFCLGLNDRDIGISVAFDRPSSVNDAVWKVTHWRYLRKSVNRSRQHQSSSEKNCQPVVRRCQIDSNKSNKNTDSDSKLNNLMKELEALKVTLNSLKVIDSGVGSLGSRNQRSSTARPETVCFNCFGKGHFARHCVAQSGWDRENMWPRYGDALGSVTEETQVKLLDSAT